MPELVPVEYNPFKRDPFDAALDAEGVKGPIADIARSIYQQESGSGKNTKTSNAGAVGGMQIIPGTFKQVADKKWDINDPIQNSRAGIRYIKQLYDQAGGDPALTAAGYYGGPGGLEKARRGVAVSDPRNPNAPTTLQYGQQVAARIPKEKGLLQRGVEAVIPSANAGELPAEPQLVPVDFDPFAQKGEPAQAETPKASAMDRVKEAAKVLGYGAARDLGLGALRGAARIGNTITNAASQPVVPEGQNLLINPETQAPAVNLRNAERQAGLASYDQEAPNSLAYQAGDLGAQIAGTAGVGGALAAPLKAAGVLPKFASALQTGGMSVGGAPAATVAQGAGNLLTRAAGGAATGGASAGLVDPSQAGLGAAIGGALPVVAKGAAVAGNALGRSVAGSQMAPEVKALADRAKQLGIDIPADRLVNSKPLNALAASLDYVPGSGRTATMNKMEDQLNTAVSRTFGQNSSNVTQALRQAQTKLGGEFDRVLQGNTVKMDQQFLTDLADAASMASKELGADGARIINSQVDEIIAKAANGDIDGQAAYNIKKTLDRIGRRNSPEAHYAIDLKQKLMEALNRSLGPQEAAAFAQTRQQYGNMLAMEKIAQNGAEGGVSIARLANMKNINNAELQELADISAQFLKGREGAHGAAQRVGAGALTLGLTGPTGLAAGMATGRGANMLLNSNSMKNRLMGNAPTNRLLGDPDLSQLFYRGAPVAGSQ